MKNILPILFFMLWLSGCTQPPPVSPTLEINPVLGADFPTEFDRLFLSDEPLRYQDNVAYLEAIQSEALNTVERALVRDKLKQFLSLERLDRDYAPDSLHTGVASEIAFLRLQSVQLLAQVGTRADAGFIQDLTRDLEGEHPLFKEACMSALVVLAER